MGVDTTTVVLSPGASEKENSQAALSQARSRAEAARRLARPRVDQLDDVAVVEIGDGRCVRLARKRGVEPIVDRHLAPSTAMR